MRTLAPDLDDEPAEMPMTPLIDMVFLLLSFFVFATQLREALPGPEVDAPVHSGVPSDTSGQGQTWRVEIDQVGEVRLTRPAPVSGGLEQLIIATPDVTEPEQFVARLQPLLTPNLPPPALTLIVDKAVPYERLSETLAGLRLAGFTRFKLTHKLKPQTPQP